jgi:hypothetical protein
MALNGFPTPSMAPSKSNGRHADVQAVPVFRVLNPTHWILDGFRMPVDREALYLRLAMLNFDFRMHRTIPSVLTVNRVADLFLRLLLTMQL